MIGKFLGWACIVSALIFAVLWEGLLFSGYKPPEDPGQRFWMLLGFCSPIMLTLLFGSPLLIFNPFE